MACSPSPAPRSRSLDVSGARYGLDFHLQDPQGPERSLADFRGKVVLLFFGFVQCADVCPTALFRNAEVLRLLGDDGSRVQGLFVTLDPERDTPDILKAYAAAFHPSFVGLRADLPRTQETAKHFKVFFRKVPSTSGGYTLDHSAVTYVYDASGAAAPGPASTTMTAREVADDVARLLAGGDAQRRECQRPEAEHEPLQQRQTLSAVHRHRGVCWPCCGWCWRRPSPGCRLRSTRWPGSRCAPAAAGSRPCRSPTARPCPTRPTAPVGPVDGLGCWSQRHLMRTCRRPTNWR